MNSRVRPIQSRQSRLLAAGLALAACHVAACHRQPAAPPIEPVAAAALHVVNAARSEAGIGPELVDENLVETLRRVQLVLRATISTWEPEKLLAAFHGETGPDKQYPVEDRPKMQRERATSGMRSTLAGKCTAKPWDQGKAGRVRYLVQPLAGKLPDEIVQAREQLKDTLAHAEAARVDCESGSAGMLFVKDGAGRYRLVDIFPTQHQTVTVNPDDPTLR